VKSDHGRPAGLAEVSTDVCNKVEKDRQQSNIEKRAKQYKRSRK